MKKQRERETLREKRGKGCLFLPCEYQWEAEAQSCWGHSDQGSSEWSFQRQQAGTSAISTHCSLISGVIQGHQVFHDVSLPRLRAEQAPVALD